MDYFLSSLRHPTKHEEDNSQQTADVHERSIDVIAKQKIEPGKKVYCRKTISKSSHPLNNSKNRTSKRRVNFDEGAFQCDFVGCGRRFPSLKSLKGHTTAKKHVKMGKKSNDAGDTRQEFIIVRATTKQYARKTKLLSASTEQIDQPIQEEANKVFSLPSVKYEPSQVTIAECSLRPVKYEPGENVTATSLFETGRVEGCCLPLCHAIFRRINEFPDDIMVIWTNVLDKDTLMAVKLNSRSCILCLENKDFETFSLLSINAFCFRWDVILFEGIDVFQVNNKLFYNIQEIEEIFSRRANVMGKRVVNFMRTGYIPYFANQLAKPIVICNTET